MKRRIVIALTLASLAVLPAALTACGEAGGDDDTVSAADTLTRRQKDELISDMPIPGAGAVGKALEAQDRANARTAGHDTIK